MGNGVFVECGKLILRFRLTNSNLKLSIRDEITIGPITCVWLTKFQFHCLDMIASLCCRLKMAMQTMNVHTYI